MPGQFSVTINMAVGKILRPLVADALVFDIE